MPGPNGGWFVASTTYRLDVSLILCDMCRIETTLFKTEYDIIIIKATFSNFTFLNACRYFVDVVCYGTLNIYSRILLELLYAAELLYQYSGNMYELPLVEEDHGLSSQSEICSPDMAEDAE
ncbi:unnamed protein product [Strongylus vulgaris]|uniref:Uncharacterized protein n=1 Tax=Strongylus vulgaris TaxID=40348 RepID=A0A3P7ISZ5_STRVU|nr:unnamed protein product [Strongylus vulgaris]